MINLSFLTIIKRYFGIICCLHFEAEHVSAGLLPTGLEHLRAGGEISNVQVNDKCKS